MPRKHMPDDWEEATSRIGKKFRVIGKNGGTVRAGIELDSEKLGMLDLDDIVEVIDSAKDGERVRIEDPRGRRVRDARTEPPRPEPRDRAQVRGLDLVEDPAPPRRRGHGRGLQEGAHRAQRDVRGDLGQGRRPGRLQEPLPLQPGGSAQQAQEGAAGRARRRQVELRQEQARPPAHRLGGALSALVGRWAGVGAAREPRAEARARVVSTVSVYLATLSAPGRRRAPAPAPRRPRPRPRPEAPATRSARLRTAASGVARRRTTVPPVSAAALCGRSDARTRPPGATAA